MSAWGVAVIAALIGGVVFIIVCLLCKSIAEAEWFKRLPRWAQHALVFLAGPKLHSVDQGWDEKLNALLDGGLPTVGRFDVRFKDGTEVWLSSWPYAFGSFRSQDARHEYVLPRPATQLRLYRMLHGLDEAEAGR